MRVSKTFKAIAASLLYERLEWTHMERNALGLIKKGNVIKEGKSNIVSKKTELQHVKSIELIPHPHHTCPLQDVVTRRNPLAISILRIATTDDEKGYLGYRRKPECLRRRDCPLFRGLTAEKVVTITSTKVIPICIDRFNEYNEGRHVDHVIRLRYPEIWYVPHVHVKSRANQIVIILSHTDDDSRHDDQHREWAQRGRESLAAALATSTRFNQTPREIVMVNFGKLDDLLDPSTVNRKGMFEAMCRMRIESIGSLPVTHEFKRTAAEANAAVTFITMKNYLNEYDWNGVYTQEEVDTLLLEEEDKGIEE
jgi:hypothetical protein